jgi:hypothetical protein
VSVETVEDFGRCTARDREALASAVAAYSEAEAELVKARKQLGRVLKRMRDKGAQRRTLARAAGVSDQTVTHMTEGRPNWRERQRERMNNHDG